MFLVPNIDQGNEENSVNIASQASIVEFRNKHGNGDEFPDFADSVKLVIYKYMYRYTTNFIILLLLLH
jgi:hypothetical protein